jgi:hypothetical protein
MLFINLTTSLGETGCQGGQGSPRAVAPNEEEEEEEEEEEDALFACQTTIIQSFIQIKNSAAKDFW